MKKLKSHGGSVLAVYSPKGKDGFEIISGAADQNVRSKSSFFLRLKVWRLEKSKILPMIEVLKPTEEELYPFKEKVGKLVNYAEGHVLNTPQALKKVTGNSQLTAYCFNGSTVIQMFSGYGDGLICYWEIDTNQLNQ